MQQNKVKWDVKSYTVLKDKWRLVKWIFKWHSSNPLLAIYSPRVNHLQNHLNPVECGQ